MMRLARGACAAFLLACGVANDEAATPGPGSPVLGERATAAKAPDKRPYWRWPEEAGPRRDVYRDSRICKEVLALDPDVKQEHPLVQLKAHFDCMKRLGWVPREGAAPPRPR